MQCRRHGTRSAALVRGLRSGALGAACAACLGGTPDAQAAEGPVDPDTLRSPIVAVRTEGDLCPEGSVGVALGDSVVTLILSESRGGFSSGTCSIELDLEVPEGFSIGMPTTILRGFATSAALTRLYGFQGGAVTGAGGLVGEDFVIDERLNGLVSPSCGGSQRVTYTIDLSAQLFAPDSFFQVDSVDVDTTFLFGTQYANCDGSPLEIAD